MQHICHSVPSDCFTQNYSREGCAVSLEGAPTNHAVVDLDCDALDLGQPERCDFLFAAEHQPGDLVVLMELKSGRVDASKAISQLKGGVRAALKWIPQDCTFSLFPILVYRKGLHGNDLARLRQARVSMHGQIRRVILMRCDRKLMDHI